MPEFLKYIAIIKNLIDYDYEKGRVFYENGVWYDRDASRNISLEELEKIAMSIVENLHHQYDVNDKVREKLYELLGEEETEKFLDTVYS